MLDSNYPPGTSESDPRAPWNQSNRTCHECRFCATVGKMGASRNKGEALWICLIEPMSDGIPEIDRVDKDDEACECFEEA